MLGFVRRAWGIDGSLAISHLGEDISRFQPGLRVYVGPVAARVQSARRSGGATVLRVDAVRSVKQAEALRGAVIEMDASDLPPLPEGEYYHHQLIDLRVQTTGGETVGAVREILETGANDVYVVAPADGDAAETLIPAVEGVVMDINLDARVMTVDLPEGLR